VITIENAGNLREFGHIRHGWISQVVWSPDGRALAVAFGDGVAMYVNGFGSTPNYVLFHPAPAKSIAFHPTKPLIATGSKDTLVRLWTTAKKHTELRGHTDAVNSIAFDAAGDMLASAGSDKRIIVWRTAPPHDQVMNSERHNDEISSIAIGKSHVMATGSWDKTVRLSLKNTVLEHDDWVRQIRFSPRTDILASASKDGLVRLWQNGKSRPDTLILAHEGGADSLAFSPDEKLLATGGRDNLIRLWDVEKILHSGTAEPQDALATLRAHTKPVLSLSFRATGTILASAGGDNFVRLWKL
jgi:WD40 repeat protein